MLAQAGRSASDCTGGKQFYVCTAGPFRGCCSIDPCTDGVCPDDDNSDSTTKQTTQSSTSTTTSSSSQTSQTTLSTSDETSTSTSSSSSSTSISTSISSTSDTASTPSTSTLSTTTPTTTATQIPENASSANSSSSNAGTIGGAVGGVLAAILLGILLFFCLKRRRKKTKVKIAADRSTSTESLRSRDQVPPTSNGPSPVGVGLGLGINAGAGADARENYHSPETTFSNGTMISSPGDLSYSNFGPPSTISSLSLSPSSNSSNIPTPTPTTSTKTTTTTILAPLLIPSSSDKNQPPTTAAAGVNHPLSPRVGGYIPELNDTGFRWGRLELPAQPCSELINQPRINYPRSPAPYHQRFSTGFESGNESGNGNGNGSAGNSSIGTTGMLGPGTGPGTGLNQGNLISRYTARKVVTKDGIIMGANLDRMSSINEDESSSPTPFSTMGTTRPGSNLNSDSPSFAGSRGRLSAVSAWRGKKGKLKSNEHVMSFMEYDDSGGTNGSIEMIETGKPFS